MIPTYFRLHLFIDRFGGLFLPPAILSVIIRFLGLRLGFLALPVHFGFILLWAYSKRFYRYHKQSREIARLGARSIPCVVGKWPGNIDILFKMLRAFKTSYVLDVYRALFEEYQCTTLNLRFLWVDNIVSMDQELSKFVLATGFDRFWRGNSQKERLETFLGEGIFNRDGEQWKMHRGIIRPFFARERISDFEIFERHTARTLAIVSSLESSCAPCEAQDLYARFTLDAASEFLFGHNLDTLSASLPIPGETVMGPKGSATHDSWGDFSQSFEMSQQIATQRARLGYFWPLYELFGDRLLPHAKVIHQYLDPVVKQALDDKMKAQHAGIKDSVGSKTFLQHLAENTEDPVVIRDQLLNILLASRDTTACLLTYVTYFMAIYPELARKLRAEVLEHCGPSGTPTYEVIRNLKYMRAVINETLRLFPPVPLNVRESRPESCVLPPSDPSYPTPCFKPLYMPASTSIVYLPLLIMRNPALWGPDADVFDPERWLQPDRIAKFVANPTMFMPFSAGPRICPGQNYAYNEASYFLVRLLQQFDTFTLAPEFQPEGSLPPPHWKTGHGRQAIEQVWPSAAMTLYIKGGMWVRFGRSKGATR